MKRLAVLTLIFAFAFPAVSDAGPLRNLLKKIWHKIHHCRVDRDR